MAKPTGALVPSDFGYDISSAGDTRDGVKFYSFIYVVLKVDLQPGKWQTVNREDVYHKHKINLFVDIAASGQLDAAIRVGKQTPDESAVFSETGVKNDEWLLEATESSSGGRTNKLPNYNETKIQPQYIIAEVKLSRNVTSAFAELVEVFALYIQAENDSAYSGNDSFAFGNSSVVKKINNPFDSLSSAMLKTAIADNMNKIMYESRNAFVVPLFGAY